MGLREDLAKVYLGQVGVREATGHNDGIRVSQYLASVGLETGEPWCAAFVAWCLDQIRVDHPTSGFCPDWFTSHLVYKSDDDIKRSGPKQGDVFGLYFHSLERVAHCGFIHQWGPVWVDTVEGNTNDDGSRDGNGVYVKRRPTAQIYAVSSWINNDEAK